MSIIFFFFWFKKRSQGNREEIHHTKKSIPIESGSKQEFTITGRAIIKNKKRSYARFLLDSGQSDFRGGLAKGFFICPTSKGVESFWSQSDPPGQRNKVYLFIYLQRIVGCLVAEPIKEAFKVMVCSVGAISNGSRRKENISCSTTLQFGDIIFQSEVEKRASWVNESAELYKTHGEAMFCENKAVTAVCGIRAIWVISANRRKCIAFQLLDAVRKSFCMGFALDHTQLAFSHPTSVGMALASRYTGTGLFMVYMANKTES